MCIMFCVQNAAQMKTFQILKKKSSHNNEVTTTLHVGAGVLWCKCYYASLVTEAGGPSESLPTLAGTHLVVVFVDVLVQLMQRH